MAKTTIAALILAAGAFAQNPGDATFYSPVIHTVKIYFSQPAWWDSLVAYKPLDQKMLGDVEIDGTYIDSVGIQFKGNSSYNAPGIKKPFKIDFNEFVNTQNYDGLKAINLNNAVNDPTMLREKIFDDFCRAAGIEAPRAAYANLYINDTLWGFYVLVEQVNKTFLSTHYGNNGGNLFKGDGNGTLQWFGNMQSSYYGKYELKTNEIANDWTDLVHLIDEINNTIPSGFYDSLEVVLNTTAWIEGWAANNIFVNLDSYLGSGHNYYIYHNTFSNKFDFIIWDANETFGVFTQGMTISQLENLSIAYIPSPSSSRPLNDKMLQNTTYLNTYVNTICNYVNNYFSHEYLDPKIDSLANVIRPYVYADPNKTNTNQQFEDNIYMNVMNRPGLKSFITNRRNSLISQLAAYGCSVGVDENSITGVDVGIYPNPTGGVFTLSTNYELNTNVRIVVYDVLGKEVYKLQVPSPKPQVPRVEFQIDISGKPAGLYFIKVQAGEYVFNDKIVLMK